MIEALWRLRLGVETEHLPSLSAEARRWLGLLAAFQGDRPEQGRALSADMLLALPVKRRLGGPGSPPSVPPWGWLLPAGGSEDGGAASTADVRRSVTKEVDSGRRIGRVERRGERDRSRSPLFHHFEKVETLQEHEGDSTRADEGGDPETEREALERMRPHALLRSREPSNACYRLDAVLDGGEPAMAEEDGAGPVRYPEWHHKRRCYREDWCALFEEAAVEGDAAAEARARAVLVAERRRVEELRRRLEAALTGRVLRRRQADGAEVDLDASVDRLATLVAGHTPGEGLYQDRRRRDPELAVWMLLDRSLSSDSWVEGVRILDVEREMVLVLGEALDGLLDEVGIACFSSNTRRCCRFTRVKDPSEPWSRARGRVMAVEPEGYTRIGPAIRHAAGKLAGMRARRRLLLLVTDGRPSDYDQYEGRYGVEDVAQAVREAHREGVLCHALAVESGAEGRLTEMFGAGQFRVLRGPRGLSEAVARILLRVGT